MTRFVFFKNARPSARHILRANRASSQMTPDLRGHRESIELILAVCIVNASTTQSAPGRSADAEYQGCQKLSAWRRSEGESRSECRQRCYPKGRDIVPRRSEH